MRTIASEEKGFAAAFMVQIRVVLSGLDSFKDFYK